MVRTWCFQCPGPGSIPGWGAKIPQAKQCGQKVKKRKRKKEKTREGWERRLEKLVKGKKIGEPAWHQKYNLVCRYLI